MRSTGPFTVASLLVGGAGHWAGSAAGALEIVFHRPHPGEPAFGQVEVALGVQAQGPVEVELWVDGEAVALLDRPNGARRAEYRGLTLHATKWLSNRWMIRGYVNWNRGEWDVPEEFLRYSSPSPSPAGGNRDGDLFFVDEESWTEDTGLSRRVERGIRSLPSSWRGNVSGMVRIAPDRSWGFDLSGNVMARQGYPLPLSARLLTPTASQFAVAVTEELDQFRLPDVVMVDLRLEKTFRTRRDLHLSVYVDGFNLTNDNSAQSRNTDLSGATPLWVTQTISPRVYRNGARLRFR